MASSADTVTYPKLNGIRERFLCRAALLGYADSKNTIEAEHFRTPFLLMRIELHRSLLESPPCVPSMLRVAPPRRHFVRAQPRPFVVYYLHENVGVLPVRRNLMRCGPAPLTHARPLMPRIRLAKWARSASSISARNSSASM